MFPVELTECWAWCEDNLILRGFKMHFSRLGESFKRLRSNSTSNCQGKTFLSILRNFHYLNRFQVPEFLHITRKKIILIVMNFFFVWDHSQRTTENNRDFWPTLPLPLFRHSCSFVQNLRSRFFHLKSGRPFWMAPFQRWHYKNSFTFLLWT